MSVLYNDLMSGQAAVLAKTQVPKAMKFFSWAYFFIGIFYVLVSYIASLSFSLFAVPFLTTADDQSLTTMTSLGIPDSLILASEITTILLGIGGLILLISSFGLARMRWWALYTTTILVVIYVLAKPIAFLILGLDIAQALAGAPIRLLLALLILYYPWMAYKKYHANSLPA